MESTMQGEINMANNKVVVDDDHKKVRDPLELDREMEKRISREYEMMMIRRRELEAEVRMELMLENQILGMMNFNGFLSDYHHRGPVSMSANMNQCMKTEHSSSSSNCGPMHNPGYMEFLYKNNFNHYRRPDLCEKMVNLEAPGDKFGEEMKFGGERIRNFNGLLSDYHHRGPMHKPGFLGFDPNNNYNYYGRPDLCRNLVNLGALDDKFGEEMKLGDEEMRIGPHPVENSVIGSEKEKQQIVEGDRNQGFDAVKVAGMSDAELAGEVVVAQVEHSSGIIGMKRKAETPARACDGDSAVSSNGDSGKKWFCSLCEVSTTSEVTLNAHLQGKKHKAKEEKYKSHDQGSKISMDIDAVDKPKRIVEPDSTPTSGQEKNKWECSLCQLSVNSETLLKSHLLGKKHKAKEAKLQTGQNISSVEECSTEKSGGSKEHSGNASATEEISKWFCSLCGVSASSESNLNDHFQGKKHKAKALLADCDTADLNSHSIEKVSKTVKITTKQNCDGGGNAKKEQQTKCLSTEVGKDGVSGQDLTELEANRNLALQATADASDLENIMVDGNKQEENEKQGNQSTEFVKYWHCKLCNKGTHDEATMVAHRKSAEHKALLRKNGGSLICAFNVLKEGTHAGEVSAVTSS